MSMTGRDLTRYQRCEEIANVFEWRIEPNFDCFVIRKDVKDKVQDIGMFENVEVLYSFLCGYEQGVSFGRCEEMTRWQNKKNRKTTH